MNKCRIFLFLLLTFSFSLCAQTAKRPTFKIVPLGVKGGSDESNLSSYMIASTGSNDYICFDAGTLHYGIEKAVKAGIFRTNTSGALKNYIKGYLISHAHLDHVAGLIINSPDDTDKNIYGLPYCLDILKDNILPGRAGQTFPMKVISQLLKSTFITI